MKSGHNSVYIVYLFFILIFVRVFVLILSLLFLFIQTHIFHKFHIMRTISATCSDFATSPSMYNLSTEWDKNLVLMLSYFHLSPPNLDEEWYARDKVVFEWNFWNTEECEFGYSVSHQYLILKAEGEMTLKNFCHYYFRNKIVSINYFSMNIPTTIITLAFFLLLCLRT